MSTYELISILKHSLSDEDLTKFQDMFRNRIESNGGQIVKTENMGKRKLAYEVRGEKKGIYFIHDFEGGGAAVAEAERLCRLDESIIKFMTIKRTKLRPIKGNPRVPREDRED